MHSVHILFIPGARCLKTGALFISHIYITKWEARQTASGHWSVGRVAARIKGFQCEQIESTCEGEEDSTQIEL